MRAHRIAAWVLLGGVTLAAAAEGEPPAQRVEIGGSGVPEGVSIEWSGTLTQSEDGTAVFNGPVTLVMESRDTRIQGDRMSLREKRYVEIEGNALLVWGRTRVFGRRMTYDLQTERGVIEDAMGQTLDEYVFWAKSVEKIGEDTVRLHSATVTTCTQPVPYWSFSVSSATIHIDNYARMWNVRVRAGRAPLLYLPFIVWPVKQDRAPGLLMPELSNSRSRGQMYRQQLFIPLGRSADLTLEGRYYTKAGFGSGGRLRAIPNVNGSVELEGFYIQDKVYAEQHPGDLDRYQIMYRQEQQFLNGFRMVADADVLSDPDFLSDYQRDLNIASAPQTLARLEFSRNGPWVSMNVRELRREQLSSGLVQQTLPEIEFRGRSRRLGRSPLYLGFEASAASIQQREDTAPGQVPFHPDYLRGDLFPTVRLPYSPTAWLDITPTVSHRATYYTQRQLALNGQRLVIDDDLSRNLTVYGVEVVGPKFSRIFRPNHGAGSQYKHAIEPRIRYGYATTFDEVDEILLYDEVDPLNGNGEQINYGLVQRLFAKRPRSEGQAAPNPAESVELPDGTTLESAPEKTTETTPPPATHTEPLEIAKLEITQSRSYDQDLSRFDVDGDGVQETSPYSPIQLTGRFSPANGLSLDLRSQYDILFDEIRDVSLSGTLQRELARLRFSVVHRNGLGVNPTTQEENPSDTQVRFTGGFSFADGKVLFNVDGSYTSNPTEGTSHFPDQRWQIQYSTQCCTLFLERLTRDFATTEDRREIFFRVDLRGIGKILSSTFD